MKPSLQAPGEEGCGAGLGGHPESCPTVPPGGLRRPQPMRLEVTSRGPGAGQVVRDTWGKGTAEEGGPAGNLKRAHKNIHKSKSHLEASPWSLRISISILAFRPAAWGWGVRGSVDSRWTWPATPPASRLKQIQSGGKKKPNAVKLGVDF